MEERRYRRLPRVPLPRPWPLDRKCVIAVACAAALLIRANAAEAQFAVIDVASVTQLIAEARTLLQQLQTARSQLAQTQSLYQSMTGSRGMQQLLNTATLNYLPTTWTEMIAAVNGSSIAYGALSSAIANAESAGAVLPSDRLAALSASEQASLLAERKSVAMLQAVAEQALSNSSGRFTDIQRLKGAIATASDEKGMLELQAAIETEAAALQNEQTKLQILYQAANARERGNRQMARELIVAGHGRFENRFEPVPP